MKMRNKGGKGWELEGRKSKGVKVWTEVEGREKTDRGKGRSLEKEGEKKRGDGKERKTRVHKAGYIETGRGGKEVRRAKGE